VQATSLGLAIGNVFWWLIPAVWGSFGITTLVGRRKKINDELQNETTQLHLAENPPRTAIVFSVGDRKDGRLRCFVPDAVADRHRLGSFYDFSRFYVWTEFAAKVVAACGMVLEQGEGATPDNVQNVVQQLREFKYKPHIADWRRLKAFTFAILLFCATCWSSFMIAYQTVTVGLGCRSMGFLIYFGDSLIAFVMLWGASVCDNRNGWWSDAEIILRIAGKALAILNAFILIGGCMLQFTGVLNNCYCESNRIGAKEAVIDILSPEVSADISRYYWWGAFGMAVGSSILCIALLWFIRRRSS
jgi:hypothetical protein